MSGFCPKCQSETERNADGKCKPCKKATSAARYAANPEKMKAYSVAWRAANPEKRRAGFAAWAAANPKKIKAYEAAWRAAHSEEIKAIRAVRYAANPEKVLAACKVWAKANPEARRIIGQNYDAKKRENGGVLSKGLSAKLFKLQHGKCPCCKQPLGTNFHLDHIIPIDLGGPNVDSNIQLLRQRCNNQKYNKHPIDFMQSRGFLI